MKFLIENGAVYTANDQASLHTPGYLFIEGDTITAVGAGKAPEFLKESADRILDATDMAVIPGLANCHTHLFQTFLRGLADDKPLLDWLKTAIWPVAQNLNPEEARMAALLGLVENLRGGATSIIDHQYIHTHPGNDDGVCQAAQETGLRFTLSYAWADMNYHPALQLTGEHILRETQRIYQNWHGQADGRIQFSFGPLIPWGCSDELMKTTYQLAREWQVCSQIHVAETRTEVEMNLAQRGCRHVEWLARLGILGPDVQLVHAVWLDDNELDLAAKHDAIVVHCPVSNMYLASGAPRIREMRKKGIPVALASDGPGSNNNQDMLEVLKTTALLAKISTLDAMALLPADVLDMAFRGGALAMGLPHQIGSLQTGKKADVVLVDLNSPLAVPVHSVASALVYNQSGSAVDTVIVDGKILMENKQILCVDEEKLLADARQTCKKLFDRAGVAYPTY
jgi:5-methylthioadenosine/S-adenosylhomocysteine deaminase